MESLVPRFSLILVVVRISSKLHAVEWMVMLIEFALSNLVFRAMYVYDGIWMANGNLTRP